MESEILANIRTTFDKWQLEQEIDILLESFYSSDPSTFNLALETKVRSWLSEKLKQIFSDEKIKKDDYLRGLKKSLKGLKELKLTLAYEPTQSSIENIHNWVRQNVGEGVIIEITVNPAILAGAIVTYQGNYRDLSFRKRFRQGFEKSRKKIHELLGG